MEPEPADNILNRCFQQVSHLSSLHRSVNYSSICVQTRSRNRDNCPRQVLHTVNSHWYLHSIISKSGAVWTVPCDQTSWAQTKRFNLTQHTKTNIFTKRLLATISKSILATWMHHSRKQRISDKVPNLSQLNKEQAHFYSGKDPFQEWGPHVDTRMIFLGLLQLFHMQSLLPLAFLPTWKHLLLPSDMENMWDMEVRDKQPSHAQMQLTKKSAIHKVLDNNGCQDSSIGNWRTTQKHTS